MTRKFWKLLRVCYAKLAGDSLPPFPPLIYEKDAEKASSMIYDLLDADKPCMIARFGANELTTMVNYLGVKQGKPKNIFKYIKGDYPDWWWYPGMMNQMQMCAGFFPPTPYNLTKFCEMMIEDIKYVDLLGSWLPSEYYFEKYLCNAQKVKLALLEPYYSQNPWSRVLKGKNVLVVHPFVKTIEEQYQRRHLLFNNEDLLPEFNLFIVPAVQSISGDSNGFDNWFDALQWMKDEIDKINYDICLIGCGAYGFPLAAHVKRQGKKAFHLGGALQLLFGIWGRRWEDKYWNGFYTSMKNEYWVTAKEKPRNAHLVENSCYW